MKHLETEALVLRETAYKETDKILTLLTKSEGKCTVRAKSARKTGHKLMAPTQLFAHIRANLFEHKGYYTLDDAQVLHLFPGMRRDVEKFALACYASELCDELSGEVSDLKLLSLMLNTLFVLSERDLSPAFVRPVVELKMLSLSGFAPSVEHCAVCGAVPDSPWFFVDGGEVYCAVCRAYHDGGLSLPLGEAAFQAMRHIVLGPEKRLFSFSISAEGLSNLAAVSEAYVLSRMEREFPTLRFLKGL